MKYIREKGKQIIITLSLILIYNLYFIFLIQNGKISDLIYIDILVLIILCLIYIIDFLKLKKRHEKIQNLISANHLIYQGIEDIKDLDVLEHEIGVLENKINDLYNSNCDMQDYIAKWSHEIKIPISTSLLMVERISDIELRHSMKMELEKINQHLRSILVGCKIQSSIYDFKIKCVSLSECVKTSIKNNQFFLIKQRFQLDIKYEDIEVYSDKEWIVYVLDQIINNAVKYSSNKPVLKITMIKEGNSCILTIEDNGEGIKEYDIKRIFERGYTGDNHHNGQYKSTGMGLYFVDKIIKKLGHEIYVESQYGKYTRFTIVFKDNKDYFNL